MVNPSKSATRQEQLSFDWSAPAPETSNVAESAGPVPQVTERDLPVSLPASSILVQVLPWDFRTSFPEPLEEAILNGKLNEDDVHPENLKSLHDEHARHALAVLHDLDAVTDARRRGTDPHTGQRPRTDAQRQRLEKLFNDEPSRLEHAFEVLIDVYEEAFGENAADAFRKAIRAWHAGIEVISEGPPELPPLAKSVQDGVFGLEEDSSIVNPDAHETAAITEQISDHLIELPDGPERQALLSRYAEDFGQEAADELDRWSRLKPDADESEAFSYDPGHPWHYYHQGDGAEPPPLGQIPASEAPGMTSLKLPRNVAQRTRKLRQVLEEERAQLHDDEERYFQLCEVGIEALSDYDRKIAHAGDEDLALASAIALTYNHIRNGRGRIRWLEKQLGLRGTEK